jgi:hypothetical protein
MWKNFAAVKNGKKAVKGVVKILKQVLAGFRVFRVFRG